MSRVEYVSLAGLLNDRKPQPPRDPETIARVLSPRMWSALRALAEGREIGFPMKSPLRFFGLIDAFGVELTPLGRDVLAVEGA